MFSYYDTTTTTMHRIKINFIARDILGRQPVGLWNWDSRNMYTYMSGGLEQMEFGGHRRVVGHRLAGGRLVVPYTL